MQINFILLVVNGYTITLVLVEMMDSYNKVV